MRYRTVGFSGHSVKFSPFSEQRIAVAAAQNFGIVGNGRLYVLEATPVGVRELAVFDTADGLYDCAWSEMNENILIVASGDGSVKVYDMALPPVTNPLRNLQEHQHECASLSWNPIRRDLFLSSSWDDTCKLWSMDHLGSLQTFRGHTYCVYQVAWNPLHGDVFLSASGDTTVRLWDVRQPQPTMVLAAHQHEVLSADWCKYQDWVLATSSTDKSIKVWDVRMTHREQADLLGHSYAVRRVIFSPHAQSILASCSYDMTVKLWDYMAVENCLLRSWDHHQEFAVGLDFSTLQEGILASAGWDEMVNIWPQNGCP